MLHQKFARLFVDHSDTNTINNGKNVPMAQLYMKKYQGTRDFGS